MRRRTEEFTLRNSANYIRNFGISMALWGHEVAEKWPKRLFTKNTGLCEVEIRRIRADTCPVPEG